MNRPTVQVHTIEQWQALDANTQSAILQGIRLKDRLAKFLKETKRNEHHDGPSTWAPCVKCEKRGWVEMKPRRPGIHPSQLPHPCLLKIYNEMVGVENREVIDFRTQLIFDLGHAIHGMFQSYGMKGAWGKVYAPEVEVSKEYQELAEIMMLEGHADAENLLTIDDIPGHPIYEVGIVHEYKSINTDQFKKLARPKPEHKQQAMLYSAALDRPIVVYMYLNKNDSNLQDFPVPFDPVQWAPIREKAEVLKNHYLARQPPPAEPGFHCQNCGYAYGCEAYRANTKKR